MSTSIWYDIHTITLSIPPRSRNPIRKGISTEQSRAPPPPPPLPSFLTAACEKHSAVIGLRKAAKTAMNKPQHLLKGLHLLTFWHLYTQIISMFWRIEMSVWLPKRVEREAGFSLDWQETSFPQWHDRLAIELKVKSKWFVNLSLSQV